MRVLFFVGITQLLVLVFIAYKSVLPELQTVQGCSLPESVGSDPRPRFSVDLDGSPAAFPKDWELTLREIVREEITQANLARANDVVEQKPDRKRTKEIVEIRGRVFSRLNYYESVGRISDLQLAALEADIVQLDDRGRREALVRLVRALNANPLLLSE